MGIRSGEISKRAAAQRFMQQPFLMKKDTVGVPALSVTCGDTLPLLSLRDIFPRSRGSLSSKGEARALPEASL